MNPEIRKLLLATNNPGKLREISAQLHSLDLEIISLKECGLELPKELEDGNTFEENALKKARYCAEKTGMATLADDSGLVVEALKGELGVKTRRWGAGENATDKEWLDFFLKRMEKEPNRKAIFVCCACLLDDKGKILKTTRGETKGILTRELQAPILPGIPLSSIFVPEGCTKVHSQMTSEEKNQVSHRGKAMEEIKGFLSNLESSKKLKNDTRR